MRNGIFGTLFFLLVGLSAKADFSNVFLLQRISFTKFVVVCDDLSRSEVSLNQVEKGEVCEDDSGFTIEPGVYKATSGHTSYYEQKVEPQYKNKVLKSLNVTWLGSNITLSYPCSENICETTYNNVARKITILGEREYIYKGGSSEAKFEWKSDKILAVFSTMGNDDQ
ncbi:MAG: hypothetical protein KDD61_10650 [Bdellovibrionales bacterium]|nr:hypothetical protein [Bdellovibrionales bacterium]